MVHRYHDATKHHFDRFSRSIGYLDWASQPHPFRSFAGARALPLPTFSYARGAPPPLDNTLAPLRSRVSRAERHRLTYDQLFESGPISPAPVSAEAIGEVLRYSLGVSAWKQFRESRWALRVNPSSGNLHPTEAYVITGPVAGLLETAAVYHYAPDRHALEARCAFDPAAWAGSAGERSCVALVALTSIHWREAWKYGERAFRYCQHDLGHAIAAVRLAAALVGWQAVMMPAWSQAEIGALVGLDRDDDFAGAEREEPACVLALTADRGLPTADRRLLTEPSALVDAAREGRWSGRANQLSQVHVEWPIIDEVARATADAGHVLDGHPHASHLSHPSHSSHPSHQALDARTIVLQRRSALAFDGRSSIDRHAFLAMLARTVPGPHAPWDALWWTPRIHLALFVHRVNGVEPGLYVLVRLKADPTDGDLVRSAAAVDRLKAAFGREFLWEPADDGLPLFCLARGDCRRMAERLSCDQEIASDGFFGLGMIAQFDASLEEYGPSFYRHLFWESGVVGQVLYLEAEAAGARATGIGCFYDDRVHEALGLSGHAFQSLYHFTVGIPVEDSRLTTEPAYEWER